ncbi:MAG: hydantoinase/oxoprolinase family protein, partial [Halobacteriota archaeon]
MKGEGDGVSVGVDVGGTFTDAVLMSDDGVYRAKAPTTRPETDGVVEAVERVCNEAGVETREVDGLAHGTTAAVNAVLERDGARTALVATEGFVDVVEIGRQDRASLYDLSARGPRPLVERGDRYGVSERTTVDGVRDEVDAGEVEDLADELEAAGVDAVAVCLLHSYVDASNERRVGEVLERALPDVAVSLSSEVDPVYREYERTVTTAMDAYVKPVVEAYLEGLVERFEDEGLPRPRVMKSDGGMASVEQVLARPVETLMSGPAAGVVAASEVADSVVSFDMGGTSTDVSLAEGEPRTTDGLEVDGLPTSTASVDVETVGAGGGSVAWMDDGGALRVGPRSTGANPGPACYGRGGTEPTVTDAACALGWLRGWLGGEVEV